MSRAPRPGGGTAWALVLLGAAWAVALVVVSPLYEVPQNDDWVYALALRQWFDTGALPHLGWYDPTLLAHAAWGGAFAWIGGLSYTTLRIATLVASGAGALGCFFLLRRAGIPWTLALVGAVLLLFDPIHLVASYSFNTDVSYVSVATWATLFLAYAASQPSSRGAWWIGGVLAGVAFLVRQPALLLAATGVGLALFDARRSLRRRLEAACGSIVPMLAALAGFEIYHRGATGRWWTGGASNLHPVFRDPTLGAGLDWLRTVALEVAASVQTLGLLVAPLAIAGVLMTARASWDRSVGREATETRRSWIPLAAVALALVVASMVMARAQPEGLRGWPYQGNYLTRHGTLPQYPLAQAGPTWAWLAATAMAPLCGAWVVVSMAQALATLVRVRPQPPQARFVAVVALAGLAQAAPHAAVAGFYDRYLLVVLPAAIVAAARGRRSRLASRVALGLALAFCVTSVEWARGYVDRARAAWQVAEDLVALGAPPESIHVGFEWSGTHLFLPAVRELGLRPPFDFEAGYPWDPITDYRFFVRELPVPPGNGLPARAYRPPFALRPVWAGVVQ